MPGEQRSKSISQASFPVSDYVTNWPLEASCCLTERILSVHGRRIPSCSRTSAVQLHHAVRLESDDLPRKMLFYFVRSVIWQFIPFSIQTPLTIHVGVEDSSALPFGHKVKFFLLFWPWDFSHLSKFYPEAHWMCSLPTDRMGSVQAAEVSYLLSAPSPKQCRFFSPSASKSLGTNICRPSYHSGIYHSRCLIRIVCDPVCIWHDFQHFIDIPHKSSVKNLHPVATWDSKTGASILKAVSY